MNRFASWIVFFASAFAADGASLDQLAAMQTLVRAEIDGARFCPRELNATTPDALARLPLLIEADVRDALGKAGSAGLRRFFRESNRIALCAARCRCGIYADWIGEEKSLAAVKGDLLRREKNSAPSSKEYAKCAKANSGWICSHGRFRALVRELGASEGR